MLVWETIPDQETKKFVICTVIVSPHVGVRDDPRSRNKKVGDLNSHSESIHCCIWPLGLASVSESGCVCTQACFLHLLACFLLLLTQQV
jgi:hypothetical protein